MPRVQIISDVHSRWESCDFDPCAQLILALGDLTEGVEGVKWLKSARRPVLYIPGNHEFYGADYTARLAELESAAAGSMVNIMNQKSAVAGGWRFLCATLWTDHHDLDPLLVAQSSRLLNDYRHIQIKGWLKSDENKARYGALREALVERAPELSSSIPARPDKMNALVAFCLHQDAVGFLVSELSKPWEGRTMVLTHHAPSSNSLVFGGYLASLESASIRLAFERKERPHKIGAYASGLEYLFSNYPIDLWSHGHLHEGLRYSLGGADVITNPSGYNDRQNAIYQPSLTLDLDDPLRHAKCLSMTLHQSVKMQKEALAILRRCAALDERSGRELFARPADLGAFCRIYNQSIAALGQQSPKDRARPDHVLTLMSPQKMEALPAVELGGRLSDEARSRALHELLTLAQANERRAQDWLGSLGETSGLSGLGWTPEMGL